MGRASFYLQGTTPGFARTGVNVQAGQRVTIRASGRILFWRPPVMPPFGNGYPRDPDGRDEHGVQERNTTPRHPAHGYIRNSLVLRIAGHVIQGGKDVSFVSPASGALEVTCNDDETVDNQEGWQLEITVDAAAPGPAPGGARVQNVGNLCIIEVPQPELMQRPGGSGRVPDLPMMAQAFYSANPDGFDFITFATDASFYELVGDSHSERVYNLDMSGLGDPKTDRRASFGSREALRSIHHLRNDLFKPGATMAARSLLHEVAHHWAIFARLQESASSPPIAPHLVPNPQPSGHDFPIHWNGTRCIAGASPLVQQGYALSYHPTGEPDVYRIEAVDSSHMMVFNAFDLYFMGLLAPEEVPPMPVFIDAVVEKYPPDGRLRVRRKIDVTPQHFIWANGPRQPKAGVAPKHFRHAFCLVTRSVEAPTFAPLRDAFERLRAGFPQQFAHATGGRGSMSTTLR